MPTMTVADLNVCKKQLAALMNASPESGTGTPTYAVPDSTSDDRRTPEEIAEAIFEADEEIVSWICANDKNGLRNAFVDWSPDLAYGDKLPSYLGPLGEVWIARTQADYDANPKLWQPAESASRTDIELFCSLNSTVYRNKSGGFFWAGALPYMVFSGYKARAAIATYLRTAALQSPQTLQGTLVLRAAARLPKEFDDINQYAFYAAQGLEHRDLILSGQESVPAIVRYQKQEG